MTQMSDEDRENAARELVIPTQSKPPAPRSTFSLDAHVALLNDIAEAQETAKFWTDRLEFLKKSLSDILGDAEEGTIAGQEAVVYEPINRFNVSAFTKAYPQLARAYSREFTETRVDTDWIKRVRPDLYSQFQSRPMRVTWKPAPPEAR